MKRAFRLALLVLGMLLLFATCAFAEGRPYLLITQVPKVGNAGGVVKGKVFNDDAAKVKTSDYRVMLYLEVGVNAHHYTEETPYNHYAGFPKPYFTKIFNKLSSAGTFSIDVTTGGQDRVALSYTVLLVTSDAKHEVVDVQRVIRTKGTSYVYAIDPRTWRSEPLSLNIPAIKVSGLRVQAGKTAKLPAVDGYLGAWSVRDTGGASISGDLVRGVRAHSKTELVYTVSRVTNPSRRLNGRVLEVGEEIPVELLVTCQRCAPGKIKLSKASGTVKMGDTFQIRAAGKNPCAWQQALTFKSSNDAVALIDEAGVVTPVAPGNAIITASNIMGAVKQVKIRVKAA